MLFVVTEASSSSWVVRENEALLSAHPNVRMAFCIRDTDGHHGFLCGRRLQVFHPNHRCLRTASDVSKATQFAPGWVDQWFTRGGGLQDKSREKEQIYSSNVQEIHVAWLRIVTVGTECCQRSLLRDSHYDFAGTLSSSRNETPLSKLPFPISLIPASPFHGFVWMKTYRKPERFVTAVRSTLRESGTNRTWSEQQSNNKDPLRSGPRNKVQQGPSATSSALNSTFIYRAINKMAN